MAAKSKIADYTFAPWRSRHGQYVVASEATWRKPERWNRGAADGRHRPRVLLTYDVFEDWTGPMVDAQGHRLNWVAGLGRIPWIGGSDTERPANVTMADVRRRLFALIDATPNLDWILLTKRPENIARMMPEIVCGGHDIVRPNLWLGTSVENQQAADERIPHLLRVPAAVRFLSCEPLLGPVDLMEIEDSTRGEKHWWSAMKTGDPNGQKINWVIVGGESGPGARPMHPDWARSLRDQCQTAGVPFFFKQWGEWGLAGTPKVHARILIERDGRHEPYGPPLGVARHQRDGLATLYRVGKRAAGRLLDGREWNEFPAVGAAR